MTNGQTIAFLNGDLMPLDAARISPMDRGFLFGDGIYEVIPSYNGRFVGFSRHMDRLREGLTAIGIANPHCDTDWQHILKDLIQQNGAGDLAIYLQVTRGVVEQRAHRFPDDVTPTVFAYTFAIDAPLAGDPNATPCFHVTTGQDQRWKRCHIKSIALLGNVLHMMEGVDKGADEILLFNDEDELTEAAACNVFTVNNGIIATPVLDQQKLGGITRNMLIDMIRGETNWSLSEARLSREHLLVADEVWLTSSTKEIAPVITVDGHAVGDGRPGPVWSKAQALFDQHRFHY